MGVSTDGIVAFGFDLGEEEELPEALLAAGKAEDEDCFEWDSVVARLAELQWREPAWHVFSMWN